MYKSRFGLSIRIAKFNPQARRAVHGPALRQYVASRGGMVLTDDHAPVDNMLAPLFVDRFVDEQ